MRIRVSDPGLVDDLADSLANIDAVVDHVGGGELEVSLLGSYDDDAMRMELYLRLRAWEAAHRARGAEVEILG
jgi:hypothetical protein